MQNISVNHLQNVFRGGYTKKKTLRHFCKCFILLITTVLQNIVQQRPSSVVLIKVHILRRITFHKQEDKSSVHGHRRLILSSIPRWKLTQLVTRDFLLFVLCINMLNINNNRQQQQLLLPLLLLLLLFIATLPLPTSCMIIAKGIITEYSTKVLKHEAMHHLTLLLRH